MIHTSLTPKTSEYPPSFIPAGAIAIDQASEDGDCTVKGFYDPKTGEYHIQEVVHNDGGNRRMSDSEMSPASKTSDIHRLVRCIFGKLFGKKIIDKKDWFDCYRSSKILTEREIDFLRRYTEDEFMDAYKTHVGIDYILNTKKITLKDSCMAMMSINT